MSTPTTAKRRANAAVLRRLWRLHFWVALFAAPALVVLACSGLVILYTQPLNDWLNRDLYVVAQGPRRSRSMTRSPSPSRTSARTTPSTPSRHRPGHLDTGRLLPPDALSLPAGEANLTQVFVDPYTGRYLGQRSELSGLVGWANQLHRLFGNDGPQVHLPSLGHLISPSAYPDATIAVGVGNLWMELTAGWILVLMASGIFLWWPRAIEATKPLLKIRWRKGGRIRWRDLHALTGVVIAVVLICYVLSGLTWSRYWGENWRAVSSTIAPSTEIDAPSTPATMGDYDRLGRRIAWAATDDPVYASPQPVRCPPACRSPTSTGSPRASTWFRGTRSFRPQTRPRTGKRATAATPWSTRGRRSFRSSAPCISTSSPARRSPTPPPNMTERSRG